MVDRHHHARFPFVGAQVDGLHVRELRLHFQRLRLARRGGQRGRLGDLRFADVDDEAQRAALHVVLRHRLGVGIEHDAHAVVPARDTHALDVRRSFGAAPGDGLHTAEIDGEPPGIAQLGHEEAAYLAVRLETNHRRVLVAQDRHRPQPLCRGRNFDRVLANADDVGIRRRGRSGGERRRGSGGSCGGGSDGDHQIVSARRDVVLRVAVERDDHAPDAAVAFVELRHRDAGDAPVVDAGGSGSFGDVGRGEVHHEACRLVELEDGVVRFGGAVHDHARPVHLDGRDAVHRGGSARPRRGDRHHHSSDRCASERQLRVHLILLGRAAHLQRSLVGDGTISSPSLSA